MRLTRGVPGRQLIHLDLKSANVLLHDDDAQLAKIADMGVSKYLAEGSRVELSQLHGAALPREPVCLLGEPLSTLHAMS